MLRRAEEMETVDVTFPFNRGLRYRKRRHQRRAIQYAVRQRFVIAYFYQIIYA